jgi:hypothetical protein
LRRFSGDAEENLGLWANEQVNKGKTSLVIVDSPWVSMKGKKDMFMIDVGQILLNVEKVARAV